jgi:hypothetical protein
MQTETDVAMRLDRSDVERIMAAAVVAAETGVSTGLFRSINQAASSANMGTDELFGALVGLGIETMLGYSESRVNPGG